MATKGTPHQGRDLLIAARTYVSLSLILYVNNANSLSEVSVYTNLVQPTGSGYAPIALNGVWSSVNGVITYDHGTPDDPGWTNTHASSNWSQPVIGAAIIGGAGPFLLHFHDYANAVTMTPGNKVAVNLSALVAP